MVEYFPAAHEAHNALKLKVTVVAVVTAVVRAVSMVTQPVLVNGESVLVAITVYVTGPIVAVIPTATVPGLVMAEMVQVVPDAVPVATVVPARVASQNSPALQEVAELLEAPAVQALPTVVDEYALA